MIIPPYIFLLAPTILGERIPASWNLPSAEGSALSNCSLGLDCQSSRRQGRQKSSALGYKMCLKITLTVQSQDFDVSIDTGSSDTVLPYKDLNDYSGSSKINSYIAASNQQLSATYGDASWWRGYLTYFTVSVKGTSLSGTAPIIVATTQNLPSESYAGAFTDGIVNQGLMGFGFPELARGGDTVVDAFFQGNLISKNAVAFLGCPPTQLDNSYVDIGNDTSYSACGQPPVKVEIPEALHHTLNIVDFAVGGVSIGLPKSASDWQKSGYSIIDSCSTMIILPTATYSAITQAIYDSDGFSSRLKADRYLFDYIQGTYYVPNSYTSADFIWDKLPTFSVTIAADQTTNSLVTITLGPKQYLLKEEGTLGWSFYFMDKGDEDYASLGYPYYASLYIVVDYTSKFMTFQPGCNCDLATDGYPTISSAEGTFRASTVATSTSSFSSQTSGTGNNNVKSSGSTVISAPNYMIITLILSILSFQ